MISYGYTASKIGLSDTDGDAHEVTPLKDSVDNEYTCKGDELHAYPSSPASDNSMNTNHFVGSSSDSNDNRVYSLLLIVLDSLFVALEDKLAAADITSIVVCSVIFVITIITIVALQSQPSSAKRISFQVPLVPWVPFLSVFVNFYLMLKLSTMTWIRFSVWMFIGLSIYIL
ncbi:unnamed protein product, partial [Medioppia subpectinata]